MAIIIPISGAIKTNNSNIGKCRHSAIQEEAIPKRIKQILKRIKYICSTIIPPYNKNSLMVINMMFKIISWKKKYSNEKNKQTLNNLNMKIKAKSCKNIGILL